jgi:hypothetical protein
MMRFTSRKGEEIIVENGIVRIPGKEAIDARKAGEIIDITKLLGVNRFDLVRFGNTFMRREIAEEAIRQVNTINTAI